MMSVERTVFALATLLVGATFLARRAAAAEPDDDDEFDQDAWLQEIKVTARRIGDGSLLDGLIDTFKDLTLPLGMRNNNPMNIRETDITWQGELPHDSDGYEDFARVEDGIRAGSIVLLNYWRIHKLNTVRGIISRWAPPADNNPTAGYIKFVAARLEVEADQPLDMGDLDTVVALATAIIRFELGRQPYSAALIRDSVKRAFA